MDRGNFRDYRAARRARSAAPAQPAPQPNHEEPASRSSRKRKIGLPKKKPIRPLLGLVVVLLLVFFAYEYAHTKNQLDKLSNPKTATESATQQLVDSVGKLVQLPANETPTIATVNNAAKLKNQAFFANAQDGDKVLIYSKSGRAVLYRPSTNKVVEYSTVNLTGGTGQ